MTLTPLGQAGAFAHTQKYIGFINNFSVDALDTTAAGDTFVGSLSYALTAGYPMVEAITFANAAAAISVTRVGALQSAPYLREIKAFLSSCYADTV